MEEFRRDLVKYNVIVPEAIVPEAIVPVEEINLQAPVASLSAAAVTDDAGLGQSKFQTTL